MDLGPDGRRALLELSDREVLEHGRDRLRGARLDHERGEALSAQADGGQVEATLEEPDDRVLPRARTGLGDEVRVERRDDAAVRRRTGAVAGITDAVRAGGVVDELVQGHTAVAVHARDDEDLDI